MATQSGLARVAAINQSIASQGNKGYSTSPNPAGGGGAVTSSSSGANPHDLPGYNPANDKLSSVYDPKAPVTSANLQDSPTLQLPAKPVSAFSDYNLSGLVSSTLGSQGYTANPDGTFTAPTPVAPNATATPQKMGGVGDYLKELTGLKPVSTADIYAQAEKDAGIEAKRQLVNNLTGQLAAINAKAQADQMKVTDQGRGIPEVIIGGQQARIAKEAAILALPLAAQISAAQGDLQIAQQHLDTYAKLLITDAQNDYQHKTDLIKSVMAYADKEDDRAFDELKTQRANEFTMQRDNLGYARDLASEALKNGQSSLAGRITSLMQDPTSKTFGSDLASLAGQIKSTGGGSGLTPAQINTTVNSIAGAFDNEPIVKDFNTINRAVQTFNSLGNSATDDIQRVYTFAKIADPTSSVKEGEYDSIEKYSQALLQRSGLKVKRVFSATGILTPEARTAMSKTIQTSLTASQNSYNQVAKEYQRQIDDAYAGKARQITNYQTPTTSTTQIPYKLAPEDDALLKQFGL